MKKTLFICTILLGLESFAQFKAATFEKKLIQLPEINAISKSNIGETLFINKSITIKPAIEITKIPEYKIFSIKHNLSVGQILPLLATKDGHRVFLDDSRPYKKDIYFGIALDETTNEYKGLYTNYLTLRGIGYKIKDIEGIEAKETIFTSEDNPSHYSYEFIYNGKSNNTLKFIYREYIKDLARPSFTQEIQYNLEESNIIGFKNMRIEVIKASNFEIEYKILNHLN